MTEENNAKKDVNDTIDSMLNQLKKTMVKPKNIIHPGIIGIENTRKEIKKYLKQSR